MKEDTLPLRLDRPTDLPAVFLDRAAGLGALLQRWDYMEQLLENGDFRSLAEDLDAYILERKVSGYHCTKELYSGFFETRGLRPLSAAAHIEEFIEYANTLIPPELLARFRAAYDEWLKHKQIPHREGMIWFCMSPYLVKHDGTDRFFKYYGGEALYWPFEEGDERLEFLKELGNPVVVEVAILASEFTVYRQLAFAKDILSHYARQSNPSFVIDSLEANLRRAVAPQEIVAVHQRDDFWVDF